MLAAGSEQLLSTEAPAQLLAAFEAELAAARSAGDPDRIGAFLALTGLAAQREGRIDHARECFVEASRVLAMAGLGSERLAGILFAFLGAVEAVRGNVSQSAANFDAARTRVSGDESLRLALDVLSGFLDVAMAARFPGDAAGMCRRAAAERIRRADATGSASAANVRIATSMLRAQLAAGSDAEPGTI